MGIKQYCKWLKGLNCDLNCSNNFKYDNIYIDMQHLLHINIHYSDNEEAFFNNLKADLYYLITNFMAKNNYILCFDGPAPYAKMLLQKKRRMVTYKDIIDEIIVNDKQDLDKLDLETPLSDTISIDDTYENLYFDKKYKSLNLTPGMPFMDNVIMKIKQFIENLNFKYYKPNFIIIDSNVQGEGEIKIFNELLKNKGSHLIICNDADVVIIAMATNIKNINVLIKYQDSHTLYSIDKVIEEIIKNKINLNINQYPNILNTIRYDIAFLSILLGNDYLPKVNLINIDNIWSTYANIFKLHVNYDTKFNIVNYETFFDNNLKVNNYLLAFFFKEYTKTKKINKYKKNFTRESFIETLPSLSNYVEGLLWCLDMYKNGKYKNHYYINDTRTPNPLELYYYFNYFDNQCFDLETKDYLEPNSKIYPLLILPYFARKITYDYQEQLFKKVSFLKSEEFCKKCSKYNTIIELNKTQNKSEDNIQNNKIIRQKLLQHKKTEHNINYTKDYVSNIIKYCNDLLN